MIRNRKRGRKRRRVPLPARFSGKDVLLFSGATVLFSWAMGASPDKALEYGLTALKVLGAKVEIEPPDNSEEDFMLGLA